MSNIKRTDVHCPSALIPADYSHVLAFAYSGSDGLPPINVGDLIALRRSQPFFAKPSGKGGCDVCGASFRYGSVFKHASGEHIVVGWECAEQIDLHGDSGNAKGEVLRKLERARVLNARRIALRAFVRAAPAELRAALKVDHGITNDIRAKLIQWGIISPAQANLVVKIAREDAARKARPVEPKVPAPIGKQTIRGEVVSVKEHFTQFGVTDKMTVKVPTDAGIFLVWVTVPSSLYPTSFSSATVRNLLRGATVEFTATLTASDRDPSFAFGKRPTKASVIAPAPAPVAMAVA